MAQTIYRAYQEWVKRSPDQRFSDLEALHEFTQDRRSYSQERTQSLSSLQIMTDEKGEMRINGHERSAILSHWAFSQLSRSVGAPAAYLRTLPPEMAKECLQYGISKSDIEAKILLRQHNQDPVAEPAVASAFTSPSYGRIWDADIVYGILQGVENTSWRLPPSKSSGPSGLYASDHDMFAFMVNEENPIEVENAKLSRGFFCWNSETGAASFGLMTFLYNHMCDNHIVWGAENIQELKIIHRSQAPERFYRAAIPALSRYTDHRGADDSIKDGVYNAMKTSIGSSLDDVVKWFKPKPFTNKEVTNAWKTGIEEGEDVTTLWGMIQGLTATARDISYTDKRVNLERRAGKLLKSA